MLSFKSFTHRQNYDAPPEVYQRKYEEYQIQYAHDVSDHFFDTHKFDEWFLDRYDPLHGLEREEAARAWARGESAVFAQAATGAPLALLNACCLEPGGQAAAPLLSPAAAEETQAEPPPEGGAAAAVAHADSGKHLRGHQDRTLYVSGIPAACPRDSFERAVAEALQKAAGPDAAGSQVDRVLVAQPSWHKKELSFSFDKCAWVVLAADGLGVKDAVRALRDCRFDCPGPLDTSSGLPSDGFSFRVSVAQHACRGATALPAHMSAPRRVAADTWRAMRIAHLLDSERGIPADCRLSYLLSPKTNPNLVNQMRQPTDVLDLSVAYLRRVHFVVYYAGLRFHDEAHLLTAPNLFVRSVPYVLPRPPLPSAELPPTALTHPEDKTEVLESIEGAAEGADDDQEGEGEGSEGGGERRRGRDVDSGWSAYGGGAAAGAEGGDAAAGDDDSAVAEHEERERAATLDSEEPPEDLTPEQRRASDKIENWKRLVKSVRARIMGAQIDRRLDHIKDDLGARARRAAKGGAASRDEADALAIRLLHEELQESFVTENCSVQEDGRARCGVESCGKLFKNTEFLVKHIRAKHMALAKMRLLEKSVEYTRVRFEAESLGQRPLPLIEAEVGSGIEKRSVKAVVDGAHSRLLALTGDGGRRRDDRADRRGGGRGRRDSAPPVSGGRRPGDAPHPPGGGAPALGAPEPPGAARQISFYVDVDEPQESAPMDLDYGVAVLPPPRKKRRSLGGAAAAATVAAPPEPGAN